jgi:hypothetical protein
LFDGTSLDTSPPEDSAAARIASTGFVKRMLTDSRRAVFYQTIRYCDIEQYADVGRIESTQKPHHDRRANFGAE